MLHVSNIHVSPRFECCSNEFIWFMLKASILFQTLWFDVAAIHDSCCTNLINWDVVRVQLGFHMSTIGTCSMLYWSNSHSGDSILETSRGQRARIKCGVLLQQEGQQPI
jgi:hypothetical protein